MVELSNIFEEESEEIAKRFSTVLIFIFLYYQIAYYYIIKDKGQCSSLPSLQVVIMVLALNIAHIVFIKNLYDTEKYSYMWLASVLPLFLYFMYNKYMAYQRRMNFYMYKQMQQNQSTPQMFNEDTTVTGVQNQIMKTNQPDNVPEYGSYIKRYNANQGSVMDQPQPLSSGTLNPYKNQFSLF